MDAIKEILAFSAENNVKSVLINYVLANKKVKSIKEDAIPDVYIEFPLGTCIHVAQGEVHKIVTTTDPEVYAYHIKHGIVSPSSDTILMVNNNIWHCVNDTEEYYFKYDDKKRIISYAYKRDDTVYVQSKIASDSTQDITTSIGPLDGKFWAMTNNRVIHIFGKSLHINTPEKYDIVATILKYVVPNTEAISIIGSPYPDTYEIMLHPGNESRYVYLPANSRVAYANKTDVDEVRKNLSEKWNRKTYNLLEKYIYRGIYFTDESIIAADIQDGVQYYYIRKQERLNRFFIDQKDYKRYHGVYVTTKTLYLYENDTMVNQIDNPDPSKYNPSTYVHDNLNTELLAYFKKPEPKPEPIPEAKPEPKPELNSEPVPKTLVWIPSAQLIRGNKFLKLQLFQTYVGKRIEKYAWRLNEVIIRSPSDETQFKWLESFCTDSGFKLERLNMYEYKISWEL